MSELPQKIGPYRVLQRLGAGGMGEVFLAYDERLDRRVAIKRIRPGAEISPERRERFRREARLAARLSHPAIIQVYDILEDGELDYIVMEYAEGTSLCELVRQGACDVHHVLELAREVADGLEAAHREGIVHRDLKTENVLITSSGRAKIMDFGIAKRLLAPEGEESLTQDHAVMGTCRAMSPEQARGEDVDHRTDLFSLGVLLYETLTGHSPFAADTAFSTLQRVVLFHPEPVHRLNPAVPEGLSRLVGDLLEKDPFLRPRSSDQVRRELDRLAVAAAAPSSSAETARLPPLAPLPSRELEGSTILSRDSMSLEEKLPARWRPWLGLALLLTLLALGTMATRLAFPPVRETRSVLVMRSQILGPSAAEDLKLLASGLDTALLRGLTALEGISPKDAQEIGPGNLSPVQAARATAADEIVTSRLECRPDACRVSLRRLRGGDGTTLWAASFDVPTDDFYVFSSAVAIQVQRGFGDFALRPGTPAFEVTDRDLRTFLRLRERFSSRREVDLEPILRGLAAIRGRAPRFLDVSLLEAEVARHQFYDSRRLEDLERAFALIRQARALAPGDPQPLFILFDVALDAHRRDEAEEALRQLQELAPGDVMTQERRGFLLLEKGDSEGAVTLLQAAARRSPSWRRLAKLARVEHQTGHVAEARSHLETLLRISPANFEGLSLLAQVELMNGSPERAARLYEQMMRISPTLSERSNLGLAYFLLGRYQKAAENFRAVAAQEPRNPFYTLNLADACFLMGRQDEASDLYRKVVELIASDPAAKGPQFLTVKAQALAHLHEGKGAIEAVQEALRIAPNDAAVAYETSLVYSLLGEDDSALVNAERALRLGYEPRWFTFPWFRALQERPEFQELVPKTGQSD